MGGIKSLPYHCIMQTQSTTNEMNNNTATAATRQQRIEIIAERVEKLGAAHTAWNKAKRGVGFTQKLYPNYEERQAAILAATEKAFVEYEKECKLYNQVICA